MSTSHAFIVAEALLAIYPVDEDGNAIIDEPVILGAVAEELSINDVLEEIEDRPSGVDYPIVHHGAELHNFEIGKVWAPQVSGDDPPNESDPLVVQAAYPVESGEFSAVQLKNGIDYILQPNVNYVVVIAWQDYDDETKWTVRTYYNATDRSHEIRGGSADDGIRSRLSMRAQYYL